MDAALEQFDAALAQEPGRPQAHGRARGRAQIQGRADEARAILERVLDKPDPEVALTYARLARTSEQQKRAVAAIDRAIGTPSTNGIPYATLLFSKGNLLEELTSSTRPSRPIAPPTSPSREPTTPPGTTARPRAIVEAFGPQKMARYPRVPSADPLPVFIVGMPRSGTSLVEQILSSHPEVHGAGELENLGRLLAQIPACTPGWPSSSPSASRHDPRAAGRHGRRVPPGRSARPGRPPPE